MKEHQKADQKSGLDSQTFQSDIVVLGGGLGGLLCGALLSMEGYTVHVLEKNKQAGGSLQSFSIHGQRFESAVHYIGSMAPGQTLHQLFNYLGILEELDLQALDADCFDEIRIGNTSVSLAQGYERFETALIQEFPKEVQGIRDYIHYMQFVCQHFPMYNMEVGDAGLKQKVSYESLQVVLDRFFMDEDLKAFLCGHHLLYAGAPHDTPFYLHALIQNSYIEGSYKFKSGSARLTKALTQHIHQAGGRVFRNAEVAQLIEKDGIITAVHSAKGQVFQAGQFISSLPPGLTYNLIQSPLIKPITRKRLASLQHTSPALMLNLVLKPKQLPYQNSNLYCHQDYKIWTDLISPRKNHYHSLAVFFYEDKSHPGWASALSVLAYSSYADWKEWEQTYHTTSDHESRGESYVERKFEVSRQLITQLKAHFPELDQQILHADLCTPLTYRDYLAIPEGSLYGFKKNVHDLASTNFATRTKLKNLYLTGQNINLHGVLGVSVTAVLTCAEITGLDYLVRKIRKASSHLV